MDAAPPAYQETPLPGLDHMEFFVGNARQAAPYHRSAFGFDVVACAGPETGVRDRAACVLLQGEVQLATTAPLGPDGVISSQVRRHGDGVSTLALQAVDVDAAFHDAVLHGARAVAAPPTREDRAGVGRLATVRTFGDTVHTVVDRSAYQGACLPGCRAERGAGGGAGLQLGDHCVGTVELGRMDESVSWDNRVFGFEVFQEFDEHDIATQYSAPRSTVVRGGRRGRVTRPLNEPAAGVRRSQIQEYLESHPGPGVPHIAPHTEDIAASVGRPRPPGAEFLCAPDASYFSLPERIGAIDEDLAQLRALDVLVDRDQHGYLLQIVQRPVAEGPALGVEVIQGKRSRGFGQGNIQALVPALEREQAERGNL